MPLSGRQELPPGSARCWSGGEADVLAAVLPAGRSGRLLGQVAGEDEGDSAAWDESLPDDQDLSVWLD